MGATRRDPTWYGADYAPPLLRLQGSGVVVAQWGMVMVQGGHSTEPLRLGGGHEVQVSAPVGIPSTEADVTLQEDEGMAETSSEGGETSDPTYVSLDGGDSNASTNASADT